MKALEELPFDLVKEGFERLLSDSKWSYKMRRKFRDVLEEIKYRNRR